MGLRDEDKCVKLIHLLCENGADVNATDVTKAPPIMTAAMWGLLECVKALLERVYICVFLQCIINKRGEVYLR